MRWRHVYPARATCIKRGDMHTRKVLSVANTFRGHQNRNTRRPSKRPTCRKYAFFVILHNCEKHPKLFLGKIIPNLSKIKCLRIVILPGIENSHVRISDDVVFIWQKVGSRLGEHQSSVQLLHDHHREGALPCFVYSRLLVFTIWSPFYSSQIYELKRRVR